MLKNLRMITWKLLPVYKTFKKLKIKFSNQFQLKESLENHLDLLTLIIKKHNLAIEGFHLQEMP